MICYQKCLDLIASFDPALEGLEASRMQFSLGNANRKVGKIDIAITFLESFLVNVKNRGVKENEGTAQLILAECYEK